MKNQGENQGSRKPSVLVGFLRQKKGLFIHPQYTGSFFILINQVIRQAKNRRKKPRMNLFLERLTSSWKVLALEANNMLAKNRREKLRINLFLERLTSSWRFWLLTPIICFSVADPKQKFRIRFRIRIRPEVSFGS